MIMAMKKYKVFGGKGNRRKAISGTLSYPEAQKRIKTITGKKKKTAGQKNPRARLFTPKTRVKQSTVKVIKQKPMKRQKTTAKGRAQDRKRKAALPGRRKSSTGRKYTERRSNRSDTKTRHY